MLSFYRKVDGGLKCVDTFSGSCRLAPETIPGPDWSSDPPARALSSLLYNVSHENRYSYLLFCHSIKSTKDRHTTAQVKMNFFLLPSALKSVRIRGLKMFYPLKAPNMDIQRWNAILSGLRFLLWRQILSTYSMYLFQYFYTYWKIGSLQKHYNANKILESYFQDTENPNKHCFIYIPMTSAFFSF